MRKREREEKNNNAEGTSNEQREVKCKHSCYERVRIYGTAYHDDNASSAPSLNGRSIFTSFCLHNASNSISFSRNNNDKSHTHANTRATPTRDPDVRDTNAPRASKCRKRLLCVFRKRLFPFLFLHFTSSVVRSMYLLRVVIFPLSLSLSLSHLAPRTVSLPSFFEGLCFFLGLLRVTRVEG